MPGTYPHRGCARRRQNGSGPRPIQIGGVRIPAHPVHPGHVAQRRDRVASNQKTAEFEFRPGRIHAQIVLADEINRATPKTQSALLEAMEERQVTVDGTTYELKLPFMVLATQNPIEYEGTFPLPEAQLDRFMLRIRLGYPSKEQEIEILDRQRYAHPLKDLGQVVSVDELLAAQQAIKDVYLDPLVKEYVVDLVRETRDHGDVYLGSSSRGALAIYRLCQARAAYLGRDYVLPDDVKALAVAALAHRIIVGPAARIERCVAGCHCDGYFGQSCCAGRATDRQKVSAYA